MVGREEAASSCPGGGLDGYKGEFLPEKGGKALGRVAHGSSGVAIPVGFKKRAAVAHRHIG